MLRQLSGERAAAIRDARLQLAESKGPESLFEGEVLELQVSSCRSEASAHGPSRGCVMPRPTGFVKALDDVTERDREFTTAHMNESALKLGIEMSLTEAVSRRDSTASASQQEADDARLPQSMASAPTRLEG